MIDRKIVGNNFVQLRNTRGLSQLDFAKHCGLSSDDIIRIEQGKKPVLPDEILQIANALKCSPCDLLLFISENHNH